MTRKHKADSKPETPWRTSPAGAARGTSCHSAWGWRFDKPTQVHSEGGNHDYQKLSLVQNHSQETHLARLLEMPQLRLAIRNVSSSEE